MVELSLRDLRAVWVWVLVIGVATVATVVGFVYMTVDTVSEVTSVVGFGRPGPDEVSFLRVADPSAGIEQFFGTMSQARASVMDQPGLQVLMSQMQSDGTLYMSGFLGNLLSDRMRNAEFQGLPAVFVGIAPPLPSSPAGSWEVEDRALLWGELGAVEGAGPELTSTNLYGIALHQVSDSSPGVTFVDGDGRTRSTGIRPVVAMSPQHATQLAGSGRVSEVVGSVTCRCDVAHLTAIATRMTDASRAAGHDRTYFAVGLESVVGPVERARAVWGGLATAHTLGVVAAIALLLGVLSHLLVSRRAGRWVTQHLAGCAARRIHVRTQTIMALPFLLPALGGLVVVQRAVAMTPVPGPMPPRLVVAVVLGILLLHAVPSWKIAVRVQQVLRDVQQAGDGA